MGHQAQNPTSHEHRQGYAVDATDMLNYKKGLYVPSQGNIKSLILYECHKSPYPRHPGYQKLITALYKEYY